MQLREIAENDLPALLDLCRQTLPFDPMSAAALRQRTLDEPNHNPRYQLGLWDGGALVGTILGGTRQSAEGTAAWVRLIAVDQHHQRRGYGTRLLREIETRLRDDGITRLLVGNSTPNFFFPGVDLRYTPALCMFMKHGFQRYADAINMLVDLESRDWSTAEEEARLAGQGYAFRRLQREDRAAFSDWLEQQWNPGWQHEGLTSYGNDPISTFVATHDGRICAFATYNVAGLDPSFGPTGTEEALRGQGIGRVLFFRCMQDLKQLGNRTAEIIWVGPIAFYARVAGAWINRTFWHMQKEIRDAQ
jgi:mycothiol synthase